MPLIIINCKEFILIFSAHRAIHRYPPLWRKSFNKSTSFFIVTSILFFLLLLMYRIFCSPFSYLFFTSIPRVYLPCTIHNENKFLSNIRHPNNTENLSTKQFIDGLKSKYIHTSNFVRTPSRIGCMCESNNSPFSIFPSVAVCVRVGKRQECVVCCQFDKNLFIFIKTPSLIHWIAAWLLLFSEKERERKRKKNVSASLTEWVHEICTFSSLFLFPSCSLSITECWVNSRAENVCVLCIMCGKREHRVR